MAVYLDVIILENFIVDMVLLKITSKVMKISIRTSRLIISSLIGGVYTIVVFVPKLEFFARIPFQIAMSIIIMFVLLKKVDLKTILKAAGVFILLSFLLCGLCYLLILCSSEFLITETTNLNDNTLKNIVISLLVLYLCIERLITYLKERLLIDNFTFDVEFELNNLKCCIRGFLDTGNELREPLTNLPCILVEEKYVNNYEFKDNNTYLIPYSAIGVKGNLKGIRCNNIRIRNNKGKWETVQAIICPCSEIFSKENDFNALLSRGII